MEIARIFVYYKFQGTRFQKFKKKAYKALTKRQTYESTSFLFMKKYCYIEKNLFHT